MGIIDFANPKIIQDDEDYTIKFYDKIPDPETLEAFPDDVAARLATGAYHKVKEWQRFTRNDFVRLFYAGELVSLEESEEEEPSSAEISPGKIQVTLKDAMKFVSKRELAEVDRIQGRTESTYLLDMAEDRFCIFDPRYKDHEIWDAYRNLPLVKECFEDGVDFPRHRIGELSKAVGGFPNFLRMLDTARKELLERDPVKYEGLDFKHSTGVAVAFQSHKKGDYAALDDEIVIEVVQHGMDLDYSEEKLEAKLKGPFAAEIDMDDFQVPPGYKKPTYKLRENYKNSFYDKEFVAAVAWNIFAKTFNVPKRAVPLDPRHRVRVKEPFLLFAGRNPKSNPNIPEDVTPVKPSKIRSLADLERDAVSSHGIVFDLPQKKHKDDLDYLIEKVDVLLRFVEALTHKGLHHRFYDGEPMIMTDRFKDWVQPMLTALSGYKSMSQKPSDLLMKVDNKFTQLDRRLDRGWDPRYFTPPEEQIAPTKHNMITSADLTDITGFDFSSSFCVGTIGGASVTNPAPINVGTYIGQKLAQNGMVHIDGGSPTEGRVMSTPFNARLKEYFNGHSQGQYLGVRADIPSRKEGSLGKFFDKGAFEINAGSAEGDYIRFNDNFHFKTFRHLAERAHVICGTSDVLIAFAGGSGTGAEFVPVFKSNLSILKETLIAKKKQKKSVQDWNNGKVGIFPGFRDRSRSIFMANTRVNGQVGKHANDRWYDFLYKMFSDKDMGDMGLFMYDDDVGEEVWAAVQEAQLNWSPPSSDVA